MMDDEAHPVGGHDVCEGEVVGRRVVGDVGRDEGVRGAVQFRAGRKGELEDGGRVAQRVDHRRRHVVRRAVDDEVAEPGLALEEGAVEGAAWVQAVQAREEGRPRGGEEVFGLWWEAAVRAKFILKIKQKEYWRRCANL